MKKLLTILGAAGLVATTGATVVACGTTGDKTFAGDDLTDVEKTWTLDAYNKQEGLRSIWLTADQYKINKGEGDKEENATLDLNLDAKTWSQIIWTGILNSDTTENALKDFNDKKLWTVLHFTGDVNTVIKDHFKWSKPDNNNEIVFTLDKEFSELLGMTLDVDVKSKTDTPAVESGLKKSSMKFEKELKIHLIHKQK